MSDFVTLARFSNPVEANIAKGKLEDAEIPVFLQDEMTVGMQWSLSNAVGGIKMQVLQEDYEQAVELLKDDENIDFSENTVELQTAKGKYVCPLCNSTNTWKDKISTRAFWLSWLLLGFPLPFMKREYQCFDCGAKWKK
ncbi:MAG: DUF2007 domain-containing protein [Bacteroidota bacterium]